MKMKKSTWLLLVLAIAAIFLVAGCAPTPPPPDGDGNGEEPPPTPPGDVAAPKVVKTMVSNTEDLWWVDGVLVDGVFKITIVFDEDIYSSCAENPNNWTVRVVNSQRRDRNIEVPVDDLSVVGNQIILYAWVEEAGAPVITYALRPLPATWGGFTLPANPTLAEARGVLKEAIDAAQDVVDAVNALSAADLAAFLIVHGDAYDALLLALNAAEAVLANPLATLQNITDALADLNLAYGGGTVVDEDQQVEVEVEGLGLQAVETGRTTPRFAGLICSEDDADDYEEVFGREVTTADVVTWSLSDNCAISDILGNSQCGYSGEACCVGPECEECVECDLTTGICK